jgi:hypothetical protein
MDILRQGDFRVRAARSGRHIKCGFFSIDSTRNPQVMMNTVIGQAYGAITQPLVQTIPTLHRIQLHPAKRQKSGWLCHDSMYSRD